ncbi:MAG: M20 family metallopeptidase [Oscillospiraceae bacterium]|nr:M20 family metallopeptidase [Oscillospiraceae bacterium]
MTPRETVFNFVDGREAAYRQIALEIHAKPEVSNYEFFACETLSEQMKREGFEVTVDVAGHRTGFTAVYKSSKPGPVLCFLAEYDALNGIGHACGHNLFGATSCLAGAALKQVIDEAGGEVRVYGTPGEEGGENGSAKGSFVREGFFKDVDAALCVHPGSDHHELTHEEIACAPIRIEFKGKASHAASAPHDGINALDAMILVFNAVGLMRQQLPGDVRIHGIITKGGDAPNIIPDYTEAKFYVRAATKKRMMDVYHKMERVVEGAALQTGCTGLLEPTQRNLVDNIVPTPSFDAIYQRALESLGETVEDRHQPLGSSDVGNVSQVIPVIQPMIRISDVPVAGHSIEKREACRSESGLRSIALGAKALALTALELIENPEELAAIKAEHAKAVQAQL